MGMRENINIALEWLVIGCIEAEFCKEIVEDTNVAEISNFRDL